jgi:hypothetical protein
MGGPRRLAGGTIIAVVAVILFAFAPSAGATTALKFSYPSAGSTVIGSTGFIDACQAGYFWSQARGDSVAQTFAGGKNVTHAILNVTVVENVLSPGNHVDWTLSINGTDVDSFSVNPGATVIHRDATFAKIKGPNYAVKIRVTNEVPGGGGSISLAYAACGGIHAIKLKH